MASSQSSTPSLWSNRTFLAVWIGHALSVMGDGFHSVALGLWILQATGSSTAMATVMAIRVAASVLLGAVAGTTVDRVNRRRLMIVTDFVRFALVCLVAFLVGSSGSMWFVFLLTAAIAVCNQFFFPAFHASLINIVGKQHVAQASSLLQMTNTLAQTVGPFLGGAVVAVWGGPVAMLADAASFLVSGIMLVSAANFASPKREASEHESFWSDLRSGLSFIMDQPLTRSVALLAPAANFFVSVVSVLLPVIAVRKWLVGPVQYGLLEAAFPFGFAIGAMLIMTLSAKMRHQGIWIYASMALFGALSAGAVVAPSVGYALPVVPLIGVSVAVANVVMQIALQSDVPAELQGRVFGTLGSLASLASPVAMMAAGVLADMFNPVQVAFVAALLLIVIVCGSLATSPTLIRYESTSTGD